MGLDLVNEIDVETVGENRELLFRVLAVLAPPRDGHLAAGDRIAGIDAHARPLRNPFGRTLKEVLGAIGVGQDDAEIAFVSVLPVGEHGVGGLRERAIVIGEGCVHHRQLVRVGADRLDFAPHRDQAVGGAEERVAEAFLHRLYAPVLPQEAVAAAGAEVGDAEARQSVEALEMLPYPRHRLRVQHLQFELAEILGHGAAVQLHDHGKRRDLPHRGLDPRPFEGQLVLVAATLEVVGGKAEVLEPLDEVGREHLPLAVEHVAAQPSGLTTAQRQRPNVVELFTQSPLVDEVGKRHGGGAVDDPEGHPRLAVATVDHLRHEQLVEIGIEHRADDRVDLPGVIVDPGGDVGHGTQCSATGRSRGQRVYSAPTVANRSPRRNPARPCMVGIAASVGR